MDGGWVFVVLKNTSLLLPFVPVSHVSQDLQRYQSNQLAQKSQGEPATSCQTEMEKGGRLGWPWNQCDQPCAAPNHTGNRQP